jgi:hypothetical protein
MKNNLDKDEQKIVESFEKGELKSVSNVKDEIKLVVNIAKNRFKKIKNITKFVI